MFAVGSRKGREIARQRRFRAEFKAREALRGDGRSNNCGGAGGPSEPTESVEEAGERVVRGWARKREAEVRALPTKIWELVVEREFFLNGL